MPHTSQPSTATSIEQKMLSIVGTHDLGDITQELCDFSLEEQNSSGEAQDILPSASSDFVPVLGKSVCCVVAYVLINDNDEKVSPSELQKYLAGKWFLPGGRMEKGDPIFEGAVCEVFEKTGLNVEKTTLLGCRRLLVWLWADGPHHLQLAQDSRLKVAKAMKDSVWQCIYIKTSQR